MFNLPRDLAPRGAETWTTGGREKITPDWKRNARYWACHPSNTLRSSSLQMSSATRLEILALLKSVTETCCLERTSGYRLMPPSLLAWRNGVEKRPCEDEVLSDLMDHALSVWYDVRSRHGGSNDICDTISLIRANSPNACMPQSNFAHVCFRSECMFHRAGSNNWISP